MSQVQDIPDGAYAAIVKEVQMLGKKQTQWGEKDTAQVVFEIQSPKYKGAQVKRLINLPGNGKGVNENSNFYLLATAIGQRPPFETDEWPGKRCQVVIVNRPGRTGNIKFPNVSQVLPATK